MGPPISTKQQKFVDSSFSFFDDMYITQHYYSSLFTASIDLIATNFASCWRKLAMKIH